MKVIVSKVLLVFCVGFVAVPGVTAAVDKVPVVDAQMIDSDLADYCSDAQKTMASTSLDVINTVHTDRKSFTKSKASTEPLTTHQHVDWQPLVVAGKERLFPVLISCKLKTTDRLKGVYGEASAGEERDCKTLLGQSLEKVISGFGNQPLQFSAAGIVVEDDELVRMGPSWLEPWPYQTAYVDESNRLHLRSKALLVPFSLFIPMPDRFKGTHYCHLPTPQYLAAILAGDIKPEPLAE